MPNTFTSFGGVSKTAILATEEYKITLELTALVALKKGRPVKLDPTTGKADLWVTADGISKLIGYAYGDCAIGELITIWTRGFMMIYAISPGAQSCGPATNSSYDSSTSIGGAVGYDVYTLSSTVTAINGWILDVATGANQLVRVLLID